MAAGSASGRAVRALVAYSVLRQAADACQTLSVNWYLAQSGSAGILGLAWITARLPWVVLPFSGALADRRARYPLIIAGDLLVAAAGTAVALGHWRAAVLPFLAVSGLGYAAARPATKGLVRQLVPEPHRAARLSGLVTSVEYLALVAAQLAAGAWLLGRGLPTGLATMAVLIGLGVVTLGTAISKRPLADESRPTPSPRLLVAAVTAPPLLGPFLVTIACGACGFAALPLAPLLAERLHGGPLLYGLLLAASALGGAGGASLARWADAWRLGARGAALVWIAAAPALALIPFVPAAWVVGCFCVLGIATGFQDAGNAARLAALVPSALQSQAMAIGSLIWRLPAVLAGLIVALTAALSPARLFPALAGALVLVAAAPVIIQAVRRRDLRADLGPRAAGPAGPPQPPSRSAARTRAARSRRAAITGSR